MPYNTVYKRFKTLLHFDDAEYYRYGDSALNELEMTSIPIVGMLYIIDMLYYTLFDDSLGFGVAVCIFFKIIAINEICLELSLICKKSSRS